MKTTPSYSEAQKLYMTANGIMEALRKQANARVAENPAPVGGDEAALDQWAEAHEDFLETIGYYEAWRNLVAAEDLLIQWASNQVATNPKTRAKFGQVAVVFEKAPRNPKFRPQLIDLCMRFAA